MTPDHPSHPDPFYDADIVGRAAQALRETAVMEGPSPRLMAQTREALRQASADTGAGRMYIFRPTLLRLAAAVAILCGGVIVVYWTIIHPNPPSGPLAQRQKPEIPAVPKPPDRPVPDAPHIVQSTPKPPVVKPNDPPQVPTPSAPVLADGVIAGRILLEGAPPKRSVLTIANAMPQCVKLHGGPFLDESLVASPSGGLANVVVSISDGLSSWLPEEFPPPPPAVLDQKGCVFSPHVVVVMVGQPLLLKNSDPMLHNVHVLAVNNPCPNVGQPSAAETETERFQSPEVFRVKCDVHPWMEAWVRVVDNPYFAVTGPDGRFSIRGLPPGTYTLKAWHEQLGVREMQVTITPGHGTPADFTFPPLPR